ncbi:transposase, partial [Amycolatopsis rhizosphaerae]
TGYRRLTLRYERKAKHFLAFLQLGAAITSWKKLRKLTT